MPKPLRYRSGALGQSKAEPPGKDSEGGQAAPQPFTVATCRGVDKACRLGLVMRDGQRRVPPRHRHRLRRLGVPQRLAC